MGFRIIDESEIVGCAGIKVHGTTPTAFHPAKARQHDPNLVTCTITARQEAGQKRI